MFSRKAFTLLELILVVIILGILASLGLTNYTKIIEKSRIAEAKTILGQIRTAQEGYKLEYGSRTTDLSALGLGDLPIAGCLTTHYFMYSSTAADGIATRCSEEGGGGGKSPDYSGAAYTVTLNYDAGTFTQSGP